MSRKDLIRLLKAVALAAATVVVLFFALIALNGGSGFAGSTGTSPIGWSIPLISGLLIGGVAWTLLSQARNHTGREETFLRSVPCPECGEPVLSDWRLCPYCGVSLPGSASSAASGD